MTLPSLPAPRTWAPGDLVTVPRLRADVTNAVAMLGQRPYFVGQRSLGDSWPTGSTLTLPLDVELTDVWSGHLAPPSNGTAAYWAPLPGWYLVDARVPFLYSSATPAPFIAGFEGTTGGTAFGPVFGAVEVNGADAGTTARAVDLVQLTQAGAPNGSGDFVEAVARQDSGSAVNFNAAPSNLPTLSVRWVSSVSGTHPLPVPPVTPVPSPITSAWLNANVRDAIGFLSFPPVLKAHTTTGSVANSSLTSPAVVSPATVDVDTYGGYSAGTYTAPVAGRYLVAGQVNFATSSTTATYACGIRVNGSTVSWGAAVRFAGTTLAGGASVTKRVRLNAGDTVQLIAAQNTGGSLSLNTTASNQTRILAVWEGA